MLHATDLPLTDEIFTHFDDDGTQRHFAASAMRRHAETSNREIFLTPCLESHARTIYKKRGIERHRLAPLRAMPTTILQALILKHPLLFMRWPDDTALLIDGSHRYVAAVMRGLPAVHCWMFSWTEGQNFLIDNHPWLDVKDENDLLKSHSGIWR